LIVPPLFLFILRLVLFCIREEPHTSATATGAPSVCWEVSFPAHSLPVGEHLYRFNVDGQWKCSPDAPQQDDEYGVPHNVLTVQDPAQVVSPASASQAKHPSQSLQPPSRKGKEPADEAAAVDHHDPEAPLSPRAQALAKRTHKLAEILEATAQVKVGCSLE
jgi:Glycogen recognition site of AMP-activated protein kinase